MATPILANTAATPTKQGWHLLTFLDGATAVVRWNGSHWVWGSLHAPSSPITTVTWLGNTVSDISGSTAGTTRLQAALKGLPTTLGIDITNSIDAGILSLGQPVLYTTASTGPTAGATTPQGNSGQIVGDAQAVGPSISVPSIDIGGVISSIWTFLTTPAKWLRVLEFAAGAVLMFIAIKALTGVDTPSIVKI